MDPLAFIHLLSVTHFAHQISAFIFDLQPSLRLYLLNFGRVESCFSAFYLVCFL